MNMPTVLSSYTYQVGLIGYTTISLEADKYGSGIHMWNVTEQDFTEYAKVRVIGS